MAENPFIFGKVVKGEHFCNRINEIEQIKNMVQSQQHTVVISPRRYGKTSLVINALERNKISYIYIDCSFIENEKDLLEGILNDYAKKIDNIAVVDKFLRRFNISFSLTLKPVSVTVQGVKIDSLKSLLLEIGRNYVLVFDEFQDMYKKNRKIVNKIRSLVQFLDKSAIMLGSKRHILENIFLKPRGIFYNFGFTLHLEKIGREEFKKFIEHHFKKNGIKITEEEIGHVLDLSELHPFFTQYFCHFLFEKRRNKKTTVEEILEDILNNNSAFYEQTFRSLAPNQRRALRLLSRGEKEIFAAKHLEKFRITSSQALQKALQALIKKELVDKNGKYWILDVFFKHWLNRTG